MAADTRTEASVWNTEVQKVNEVKGMAKNKYYWIPFFAFISFGILLSDGFYGVRNISINNDFLTAEFDLNILKILAGAVFMFLPFAMLKGMGRRIGGWVFLVVALLCPAAGTIPVIQKGSGWELPLKTLYVLLFLTVWHSLTFYAYKNKLPFGKIIKTFLLMAVLAMGVGELTVLAVDLGATSTSFFDLLKYNEFNMRFAAGITLILLALTFLWKNIIISGITSRIFADVLYWSMYLLPIAVSVISIWGYVFFDRKSSLPPASWFTLETTILSGCFWMLILFGKMSKYRIDWYKSNSKNSNQLIHIPIKVLKIIVQAPLWFFLAALLLSDIFIGIRSVSIPNDTAADGMSWSATFDVNLFKIVIGIALMFILRKLLRNNSRIIAGWICLAFAFLCPVTGSFPVMQSNVSIDIPIKMLYTLLFLSCWFVLTFSSRMKVIATSKIIKVFGGMTLFMAGIFEFMILRVGMSSQAVSYSDMLRINEFNLPLALGLVFVLSAITLLWKYISEREELTKIFGDILYVVLFALPVVISIYTISGYIAFERQPSYLPGELTLEGTLLCACLWMLILFHMMYKYRISQGDGKHDLQYFLSKYISADAMKGIFQIPVLLFMAALLFSDVFLGVHDITVPREVRSTFFIAKFDLNLYKLAVGFATIPMLLNMLKEKNCRIAGWICLGLAFINPMRGIIPIVHDGFYFEFPIKTLYMILFLSCWFVLTFYAHIKDYALVKAPKACFGVAVFVIGIYEFIIFVADMDIHSVSLINMVGMSKFNLNLILGFAFILLAVTVVWKDVSGGEGSSKISCEIMFWSLFIVPVIISLISIWGYVTLITKAPLASFSHFTLNWAVYLSCGWMIVLFRVMYNYRKKKLVDKKDSYYYLAKFIPSKALEYIFQIPAWIFFASAPMFIIYTLPNIFFVV